MPSHPTWFAQALADSVSPLGDLASRSLAMMGMLSFEGVRSNFLSGLDFARDRGRPLWAHQGEAIVAASRHIGDAGNDPVASIIMPTGSGKTELILRVVEATGLDVGETRLCLPTLVLEPTRQLVEQTLQAFRSRFPSLHVSSLGDGAPAPSSVTVMTYDLFVDMVRDGRLAPGDVKAIAMDEAHRGLSDLRQDALGRFLGNTVLTAYSASPAFDAVKNVHALLGARNEVLRVSDERMRQEGVISPVVDYVLRVAVDGDLGDDPEYRAAALRLACEQAVWGFVADHKDSLTGIPLKDRAFLGFTNGVARARSIAATLSAGGFASEAASGAEGTASVARKIARLARGDVKSVINDQVLVEGIDVPEVKGVMAFAPTKSLVKHLQRCGRCRRIDPRYPVDDPRQVAGVVEVMVEVNGTPLPDQRIYAEAIGDLSVARTYASPSREARHLLEEASERGLLKRRPKTFAGMTTEPTQARPYGPISISGELASVHYLLARRDEGAERHTGLSDEAYLSKGPMAKALRVSDTNTLLVDAYASLRDSLLDGLPAVVGGTPVRAALGSVSGLWHAKVHADDASAFHQLLGMTSGTGGDYALPERHREGWLPFYLVADALNMHRANRHLRGIWDDAVAGDLDLPLGDDGGPSVRMMQFKRHRVHYLHTNALQAFGAAVEAAVQGDPRTNRPKTAERLGFEAACRAIGAAPDDKGARRLWSAMADVLERHGSVTLSGHIVDFTRKVKKRGERQHASFSLGPDSVEAFSEAYRQASLPSSDDIAHGPVTFPASGERTGDWLTMTDAAAEMGARPEGVPGLREFWRSLDSEDAGSGEIQTLGRTWTAARRRSGVNKPMCLHRSELAALCDALGRAPDEALTSEWVSLGALAQMSGLFAQHNTHLNAFWNGLRERFEAGADDLPYRMAYRKHAGRMVLCVHVGSADALISDHLKDKTARLKTPDWLNKGEVRKLFGGLGRNERFEDSWALLASLGQDGPVMDGARRIRFEARLSPNETWCLHKDEIEWFSRLSRLPVPIPASSEYATLEDARNGRGHIQRIGREKLSEMYDWLSVQVENGLPPALPDGTSVRFALVKAFKRQWAMHVEDIPMAIERWHEHKRQSATSPEPRQPRM